MTPPRSPPADVRPAGGGIEIGAGEHESELVAAEPGGVVTLSHAAGQDAPELGQGLVARRVAEVVVHQLEVVDVDHEHCEYVHPRAARPDT